MNITVLGLGAMGRRMAKRLAAADVALTVWSRSGVPVARGRGEALSLYQSKK